MCVSVLWFPPLLFFLPGVVGSQESEATTKLPGDYFFWFNATTISSKVTRALNTGFTADLKNILGLQRHCEAFPVQIQLFPAHNPWTLRVDPSCVARCLRWSRVATKPAWRGLLGGGADRYISSTLTQHNQPLHRRAAVRYAASNLFTGLRIHASPFTACFEDPHLFLPEIIFKFLIQQQQQPFVAENDRWSFGIGTSCIDTIYIYTFSASKKSNCIFHPVLFVISWHRWLLEVLPIIGIIASLLLLLSEGWPSFLLKHNCCQQ